MQPYTCNHDRRIRAYIYQSFQPLTRLPTQNGHPLQNVRSLINRLVFSSDVCLISRELSRDRSDSSFLSFIASTGWSLWISSILFDGPTTHLIKLPEQILAAQYLQTYRSDKAQIRGMVSLISRLFEGTTLIHPIHPGDPSLVSYIRFSAPCIYTKSGHTQSDWNSTSSDCFYVGVRWFDQSLWQGVWAWHSTAVSSQLE